MTINKWITKHLFDLETTHSEKKKTEMLFKSNNHYLDNTITLSTVNNEAI